MRIGFFGSGAFGLPTLEALAGAHELAVVVTQPDRPAGRKMRLTPTPVGAWAEAAEVKCLKSEDVNTPEFVAGIADFELDASVVIAFGQKLCPELIEAMGRLAVNLHGSLLPAYRGAAPVQRAVMDGLTTTGVSVIALAQRMDAGQVYATSSLAIRPTETAGDVHDRLSELGPSTVIGVLRDLDADTLSPITQDESLATTAPKLKKTEGTTGFDGSAAAVRARINGLNPWPGCRVAWRRRDASDADEPTPLLLRRVSDDVVVQGASVDPGTVMAMGRGLAVATAEGPVALLELQAPGTRVMSAEAFVSGHGLSPGDRLGPWQFDEG